MKKAIDKPDFQKRKVPSSLESLPRFAFTPSRPSSREQSSRGDIAFGVRSAEDLFDAINKGFAERVVETPSRGKKK